MVYKELEGLGIIKLVFVVMGEKNADKDSSYYISNLGFSLKDKEKLDSLSENLNIKEVHFIDLYEIVERVLPSESVLIVPESGVSSLFYINLNNKLDTYRVTGSFSDHLKELMLNHGKLSVFSLKTLYEDVKISCLVEDNSPHRGKLKLLWESINLRIPKIPIMKDRVEEVKEEPVVEPKKRFSFSFPFKRKRKEVKLNEGVDYEEDIVTEKYEENEKQEASVKMNEQEVAQEIAEEIPAPVTSKEEKVPPKKKDEMVLMEDIWELDDPNETYNEDETEPLVEENKRDKGFPLGGLVLLIVSAIVVSIGSYLMNHKESPSLKTYIEDSILFMAPKLQPDEFSSLLNNVKILRSVGVIDLIYSNEGNEEIITFTLPKDLTVEKINETLSLVNGNITSADTFMSAENVQMFSITISKFELIHP